MNLNLDIQLSIFHIAYPIATCIGTKIMYSRGLAKAKEMTKDDAQMRIQALKKLDKLLISMLTFITVLSLAFIVFAGFSDPQSSITKGETASMVLFGVWSAYILSAIRSELNAYRSKYKKGKPQVESATLSVGLAEAKYEKADKPKIARGKRGE